MPKNPQDLRQQAEHVLSEVEDMYAQGKLGDSEYCKCMVSLSMEWLALGELNQGLMILNRAPKAYYRDILVKDMAADPDFSLLVQMVAAQLVALNVVPLVPPLRATQAPAMA